MDVYVYYVFNRARGEVKTTPFSQENNFNNHIVKIENDYDV